MLLAVAFTLRVSTILWGLPIGDSRTFHPDEHKYLAPAIEFLEYYGTVRPFPLYGTSLQYLIGLLLVPVSLLAKLLGVENVYAGLAWLLCRAVVVALGTMTVFLTAIAGLLTFAVLNPQFFLGFDEFAARVARDKTDFWDRLDPGSIGGTALVQAASYTRGVGPLIAVLCPIGLLFCALRDWRLALPWVVFLAGYSLFFRHFMLARYTIFTAPVVCMFAAVAIRSAARLLRQPRTGVWALAAAVAVPTLILTFAGISSRIWDPRITASRFVSEHYPPGTRVAFSVDSEDQARAHRWRYPRLDTSVHREVMIWDGPDLVVTSAQSFAAIEAALASGHFDEAYHWDPRYDQWWHRYAPPSPRLLAF